MITRFLVGIYIFAVAEWTYAGAVSSGGSKLRKTELNPWWLENTTRVTYCIVRDAQVFPVSVERLREIVLEGIEKWKEAFRLAPDGRYEDGALLPYGQLRVATQEFVEEPCGKDTFLRFNFGYLSEEDKKFLDTPEEYVGVAVRTDYDRKHLQGKGYIYVAPLKGEDIPDGDDIANDAWEVCNNCLLKVLVWHELGHVFGLDDGDGLMNDHLVGAAHIDRTVVDYYRFPDGEPVKPEASLLEAMDPKNAFIAYEKQTSESCMVGSPNIDERFFNVPVGIQCKSLVFEDQSILIKYSPSSNKPFMTAGRIIWSRPMVSHEPLVTVYLPKEQRVFSLLPNKQTTGGQFISGEGAEYITAHGFFEGSNGQKKPMYLKFSPWRRVEATGAEGKLVIPDLILTF